MVATRVAEALGLAAEVGPYFAVETGDGAGWVPFHTLLDDPRVLAARVLLVRTTIAERAGLDPELVEERACASLHFLGLTSRVLAPALGAAALAAVVPDIGPDAISWQPVDGGPIPMRWAEPSGRTVPTAVEAAAGIDSGVLSRVIAPLVQHFATSFHISGQVLWGNAASALAGAAATLTRTGRSLRLDPVEIVSAAMQTGALAGTGAYLPATGAEPVFVRDNCCLFYRIPGGGLCGDCVLAHRSEPLSG
jgi:ferric iron reductase protein FhuF